MEAAKTWVNFFGKDYGGATIHCRNGATVFRFQREQF